MSEQVIEKMSEGITQKEKEEDKFKVPKVHLLKSGSRAEARCGIKVAKIVPYRKFSDNPCDCCIHERMKE